MRAADARGLLWSSLEIDNCICCVTFYRHIGFTYASGTHMTTFVYFNASDNCATHTISCKDHEENISDLLPLFLHLDISPQRMTHANVFEPKINWKMAIASNHIETEIAELKGKLLYSTCQNVKTRDSSVTD